MSNTELHRPEGLNKNLGALNAKLCVSRSLSFGGDLFLGGTITTDSERSEPSEEMLLISVSLCPLCEVDFLRPVALPVLRIGLRIYPERISFVWAGFSGFFRCGS